MLRNAVAALYRWLGARRDDMASLLWIVANLGQVVHSLQVLIDMRRHGGSLVCVPPQAPLIRTLVQLDGDFTTFVDPRIFAEGRSAAARSALIVQHAEALRRHLPAMTETFGVRVAGCVRAVRDIALTGWVVLEALAISGQSGDWRRLAGLQAAGWDALGAVWPVLWPMLLGQAVAIGVPALLVFAAPRLLRFALHRGWLR